MTPGPRCTTRRCTCPTPPQRVGPAEAMVRHCGSSHRMSGAALGARAAVASGPLTQPPLLRSPPPPLPRCVGCRCLCTTGTARQRTLMQKQKPPPPPPNRPLRTRGGGGGGVGGPGQPQPTAGVASQLLGITQRWPLHPCPRPEHEGIPVKFQPHPHQKQPLGRIK